MTATSKDGLTATAEVTYTVSPSSRPDPAGAYNQGFNAGFNTASTTG